MNVPPEQHAKLDERHQFRALIALAQMAAWPVELNVISTF
jgi:hypothetical protein